VKQIVLLVAGLVVAGCCSTQTDIQRSPTSDLQLRRYELMYCLTMVHMSSEKQPLQSSSYDEVRDNLDEKEAIEREIQRREVTNYHWPPSVPYQYIRDHCNCQDWIVTLGNR
jgi:hypothetical protein